MLVCACFYACKHVCFRIFSSILMNVLAFWRIKIHTINRFIGTNKRRVINVAVDDVRGGRSLLARAGAIAHITTKHHLLSACFFSMIVTSQRANTTPMTKVADGLVGQFIGAYSTVLPTAIDPPAICRQGACSCYPLPPPPPSRPGQTNERIMASARAPV